MARRTSEHEARILDFEEARRPAREQSTRAARPSTRRATHTASSRSSARGESSSQPVRRSTGAASSSQVGSVRRLGCTQPSAREESFCHSASTASSRHSTRPRVSARQQQSGRITSFFKSLQKKRLDKRFDRSVRTGDESTHESSTSARPKAALYSTHMGRVHRKSSRMQNTAARTTSRAGSASTATSSRQRWVVPVCVVAFLVLCGAFLYAPAKDYYIASRDAAKTQAEYNRVSQENSQLQSDVESLSTDEGIEDRAREDYGWVKEGENSVSVSGLSSDRDQSTNASSKADTASEAKVPTTWYSGILDAFFGYKDS